MDKNKDSQEHIDRSKIQFNNVIFRDINEFVIDLKNIFNQMVSIKNILVTEYIINTFQEMSHPLTQKLKDLEKELKEKINYITDSKKVDPAVVGDIRVKLIQFRALLQSTNITDDIKKNVDKIVEHFSTRVLENKIAITGKIFPHNKKQ